MYKKRQLNSGLKICVSPMPDMTSVSLGIWVGIGGRYESLRQSGMSHLIEHMLFKGTHTRSTRELKESVEGVGGSLNGFTADEVTCYMIKVPAKHLSLGLDILTDMVFNAKFDEKDLAKEKFVICEEIKMYKDQPAEYVGELLGRIMWPGNPLGRPLTGTITAVRGFRRGEIIAFKEKNYHPANMAVIAVGKLDPEKIFREVSKTFRVKRKKKPLFRAPATGQKRFRMKLAGKDTEQTHIAMGFHAVDRNIREKFSIRLLNIILGGNMSSRLFEELREKSGLCYDIASMYKRHSDVGEFIIHAGVDNRNALRSVAAIIEQLRRIKDLGITEDELARAKEFTKGQFLLAMESTSARMMWFGYRLMVDRFIPDVRKLLRRIDSVTKSDVKRSCENIFRSSSVNLAMIGSASGRMKNKIRKELGRL